jgi:hypothetical protein
MDGADPSEPVGREPSIRRPLAELTERQGWVHHVVDVDTGEVLTTPLDRPLAPLSRAERLAGLGHGIPPPSPWGPVYKLTARSPYQTAPLNWLTVYDPVITLPDAQDHVYWSLPEDFQRTTDLPGLRSHFDEPPQQRCVATLVFAASAWAGRVGHIRIAGSANGRIPIAGGYAQHTVDLSFAPSPGSPVEIFAFLEPGLHQVVFYSITLQAERVIVATPI